MYCSRVGLSGTADLMALFSIRINSRWRPPRSWIISNGHISATAHDLLIYRASRGHLCDSTAFLFSMALFSVRTNPIWRPPPSWIISNSHISATAHKSTYIACNARSSLQYHSSLVPVINNSLAEGMFSYNSSLELFCTV